MLKSLLKICLFHREADVGAIGLQGEAKQLKILTSQAMLYDI